MGKRLFNMTVLAAVSVAAAVSTPAIAAPPTGPSGSIAVASDVGARPAGATGLQYDGTVAFDTTVDGKISKHARVYVTVVCWQGDTVVFQYSANPDFEFPLTDQPGQGLDWDGEAASCEGRLIRRVDKGRSTEILVLDTVSFDVAGTTATA